MRHVDLAAHVDQRGDVAALQLVRDLGDGHHVLGDVLAFHAVAARRRLGELAILVAQRDRQPVDLRLGGEGEGRVGVELQEAVHALDEVRHVLGVERIAERQHRHAMAHLAEALGRGRADAFRGTVGPYELGEALFDRRVAPAQHIVLGVGNLRRVLPVVELVVVADERSEAAELGLGIGPLQVLDGGSARVLVAHRRSTFAA